MLTLGQAAPGFRLKGTDGGTYALEDVREGVLVVVFSCNHCPYVQAYEERMIQLQKEFAGRVRFVLINSNDDGKYPDDSFEEMVRRARAKGYPFPYLRDESQEVARAYGATHTPHLFVFDKERKLAYTGKIDDNWQEPSAVRRAFLREALDSLLAGRPIPEPQTHAIGCTIKWR